MAKESSVRYFLDLLTLEEITDLYKHFTGVKQIKFKDRQQAEERLIQASFSKPHHVMIKAFEDVGMSKDTWMQFGGMLRGPIMFPHGPMKPEELKRHAKALAADRKKPEWRTPDHLTPAAAAVLKKLRELIPAGTGTEKEKPISSTELAQKLDTNLPTVCKSLELLKRMSLLDLEDDSTTEHKFYWITLLPAGQEYEIVETPVVAKLPASQPGPRSNYSGQFIFKLVANNPRREGTHGWKGWQLYEDGMPYETFRQKGGRNNDLQWDIDKRFVELRSSAEGGSTQNGHQPEAPKPSPKAKSKQPSRQDLEAELAKAKAQLAAQEAKPTGTLPNGDSRAVSKGRTDSRDSRSVAPRARKVLRKSKTVQRARTAQR